MAASPLAPAWLNFPNDVNALREIEWATGVARGADGQLAVQGIPVSRLAEEFGTPLFVLDENDFRARAAGFKAAFDAAFKDLCGGVDVYYAGKAFLCTEVARWVTAEGLRLDTCSGGELAVAAAAGVPGENLSLHGNNKSAAEITRAIETGVGRIVVDSLDELQRVTRIADALGRQANVMLRITPGVHASTHEAIATAHEDQKFGLSILANDSGTSPALAAVARALDAEHVNLLGLHAHIGSQIFEAEGFAMAARTMLGILAQIRQIHGVQLGELDLGGGYGIAYTSEDHPSTPVKLAAQMAQVVSATCAELQLDCPRISIEPGRAIAGPSTFTLYEAGVRKDVQVEDAAGTLHPRRYVSVDGGMSDNPRPVLYDAQYTAVLAGRMTQSDAIISRVVGKHCESGDIVVKDVYLPEDLAAGDLLAVPATGAYCWALSSNYNYLTRPAVVAVRDGEARLIVRRETEADLLARDMGV
ncbi:diaminopimelate decarboxylase [Glutamicibacter protophormiae]|uniref:Diaminopimelate decarboxylase n=1 Tax=Glutamicibacter protophormiae TaxID=37930 RepID=A0ABS4XRR3_GLUPR|nr:diaminopimelate decarboxylase [Glutamicibacter protophormiae]MBP2399206.1 diaminopimelate decarboxylase [Glutamicibacter protophormiae]GGL91379.1 diaminopimelate decarboxylase [Glutamicibacter protophormiae]